MDTTMLFLILSYFSPPCNEESQFPVQVLFGIIYIKFSCHEVVLCMGTYARLFLCIFSRVKCFFASDKSVLNDIRDFYAHMALTNERSFVRCFCRDSGNIASDISSIIKNGSNRSHFLFKRGFVILLLRRTVLPRYPIP